LGIAMLHGHWASAEHHEFYNSIIQIYIIFGNNY
jgi:hypothetical protein